MNTLSRGFRNHLYWRPIREGPISWAQVLEEEHETLALNKSARETNRNALICARSRFECDRAQALLEQMHRVDVHLLTVWHSLADKDPLQCVIRDLTESLGHTQKAYQEILSDPSTTIAMDAWQAMHGFAEEARKVILLCWERRQPCFHWYLWRKSFPWTSQMEELTRTLQMLVEAFYSEEDWMRQLMGLLHGTRRSALCLSGGGIRSASFALGILQGLAKRNLLSTFDYLSTVSGGGYTGGWLCAWLHRRRNLQQEVFNDLKRHEPVWTPAKLMSDAQNGFAHGPEPTPEPKPVWWIRSFSRYLSPRLSPFSGDLWALVATVMSNIALNWLVLLPVLAGLLMIPHLFLALRGMGGILAWQTILSFGLASTMVAFLIALSSTPSQVVGSQRGWRKTRGDVYLSITCQMLGAFLIAWAMTQGPFWDWEAGSLNLWWPLFAISSFLFIGYVGVQRLKLQETALIGICSVLLLALWLLPPWRGSFVFWDMARVTLIRVLATVFVLLPVILVLRQRNEQRKIIPMCVFAGALLIFGVIFHDVIRNNMLWWVVEVNFGSAWLVFGFPMVLLVIFVAQMLAVGFNSRRERMTTLDREWFARFGGYVLMAMVCWIALFGTSLYIERLVGYIRRAPEIYAGITGGSLATAIWGMLKAGGREGQQSHSSFMRFMTDRAAPIAGLAGFTACVVLMFLLKETLFFFFFTHLTVPFWMILVTLFCLALLVALVSGYFVPLNKFSLHELYRNRLIRTFLGASRSRRRPDPLSGFDKADDIPMHALRFSFLRRGKLFPVINLTLNAVYGEKLGWRDRIGRPFTVSPMHCGSPYLGFRATRLYGNGISLASAIATSGAPLKPGMGYHRSGILSAIMTFFSVRLGVWLGNPGRPGDRTGLGRTPAYRHGSPPFFLRVLLREALGMTHPDYEYVNLSDGGHFENLGIYAMVARRCHLIVVSDASADSEYTFDELGRVIRQIRIDQGIPIEFQGGKPHIWPAKDDKEHGAPGTCLSVASIRYSAVDIGAPDGLLVYIKPVLLADETVDVTAFASTSPQFPHESATSQLFSETQFESYRILGLHAIDRSIPDSFGGTNPHQWVEALLHP